MAKTKRDSKLIDQRQQEQKKLIVDQLRKIPIIQVACEKNGVARATYYRWVAEDETFALETEDAIREGTAFINDMAESQLITLIKDQNYPAISFWLRNRHKAYADKLRIQAEVAVKPPEMSPQAAAQTAELLQQLEERRTGLLNNPTTYVSTPTQPGLNGGDGQDATDGSASQDSGSQE